MRPFSIKYTTQMGPRGPERKPMRILHSIKNSPASIRGSQDERRQTVRNILIWLAALVFVLAFGSGCASAQHHPMERCLRISDPEIRAACARGTDRALEENRRDQLRAAERGAYLQNRYGYQQRWSYPGAEYYVGNRHNAPSRSAIIGSWSWGGNGGGFSGGPSGGSWPAPGSRDRY